MKKMAVLIFLAVCIGPFGAFAAITWIDFGDDAKYQVMFTDQSGGNGDLISVSVGTKEGLPSEFLAQWNNMESTLEINCDKKNSVYTPSKCEKANNNKSFYCMKEIGDIFDQNGLKEQYKNSSEVCLASLLMCWYANEYTTYCGRAQVSLKDKDKVTNTSIFSVLTSISVEQLFPSWVFNIKLVCEVMPNLESCKKSDPCDDDPKAEGCDADGDGILNEEDECPNEAEIYEDDDETPADGEKDGCPKEVSAGPAGPAVTSETTEETQKPASTLPVLNNAGGSCTLMNSTSFEAYSAVFLLLTVSPVVILRRVVRPKRVKRRRK